MRIDLKHIELHSPVFLGGINFAKHITPTEKGGCEIYFDTELNHTVLIHKGNVALIQSVASMTLTNPAELGIKPKEPSRIAAVQLAINHIASEVIRAQAGGPGDVLASRTRPNVTAQVETPISKVQGKPGRRPKYQGEESQGE